MSDKKIDTTVRKLMMEGHSEGKARELAPQINKISEAMVRIDPSIGCAIDSLITFLRPIDPVEATYL